MGLVGLGRLEFRHVGPPSRLSELVADPIEDGLPQVRLEGALAFEILALDLLKRLEEHILHKVGRVG